MFTYINENFLHAPSVDLSRETVKTLISITLAQAQEVFLEKQVADGKKAGLLAKLAAQAHVLYSQAIEGCQENVGKGIFDRSWVFVVQTKAAHMASLSEYYQALADEDSNGYGTAVARLQLAEKSSKSACSFAKSVPSSPSPDSNLGSETGSILVQITKRHFENVQEKLSALIKDNDFIYHQTVPAEASLSAVSKLPAAKAIPVSELYQGQDIQKIIGPDIFQRLVPMSVTEQASMYDEEKAKLIRSEAEKVETANGEMEASLDYLKLPQSLNVLKGGRDQEIIVEDEFRRWCEDLAGHEPFSKAFEQLQKEKSAILSSLSQDTKQLDMEESVCEKMRSKYGADWTQQPSSRLTSIFRSDIRNYRDTIDEAGHTDSQLMATARQYENDFEEMRSAGEADEADILFQRALIKAGSGKGKNKSGKGSSYSPTAEGNLLDDDYGEGGPTVADQIARVEELLKKLNLVKRERAQVLKDLKEKVSSAFGCMDAATNLSKAMTDDISNVLILNKKSILNHENQLFQAELEKFRSHQNRLLSTVHKQQSLLKELAKTYGDLLQDKRVQSDQQKYEAITRSRTSVMTRYRKVFQVFEDLREGLQRAGRFYSEMRDTVDSIGKNVEGFVNNRRAEGAQLLSQIEQNKASSASTQASAERERLQQLMERMSMNPSTASSGGSESRPPPLPSQPSYQNSRSPPVSPQHSTANPDPRFTIPPQKTPRSAESQPYHQSHPPNGYQYPPQQQPPLIHSPHQQQQQQQYQQPPHAFSQGAAAPLSEGYHPMAYPYQTPISSQPAPNHQFFPPISTTPQPNPSFYPPHQSPPPTQLSFQAAQPPYQQHGRFPGSSAGGGGGGGGSSSAGAAAATAGGAYVPPPPPGPPPGSMTSYPPAQGPMPSGPGGYAQIGRQGQQGPGMGMGSGPIPGQGKYQQQQQQQQQPPPPPPQQNQGQGDPWAGLNAWR